MASSAAARYSIEIVAASRARYLEGYERITGLAFADWPGASPAL